MSHRNPRLPGRAAGAARLLALAMTWPALPVPGQAPVVHRTPDGTTFLLAPVPTRTVHWLNLQPANPADEPRPYPDLAMAITRASLLGPARPTDGRPAGDRTSPLAWELALRQCPASGSEIVRVAGHLGVRVTFPARSLGPVAQLLRLRSRRDQLVGLRQHFAATRIARHRRLAETPHLRLLARALDRTDPQRTPGSQLIRTSAEHLDETTALAYYRYCHHPSRAVNVLVGDFQAAFAQQVLDKVFQAPVPATDLPTAKTFEAAPIRPTRPAPADTLVLACPLPDDRAGVAALLELVAGDDDSFLPDFLRAAGHPDVAVTSQRIFTGRSEVLLVQVALPGQVVGADHALARSLGEACTRLVDQPPVAASVERTKRALAARRARQRATPEGLAEWLAVQWIETGTPAPRLAGDGRPVAAATPDAAALQALAGKVFSPAARTIHAEAAK